MLLGINDNRYEQDNNNHRAGDYCNYNYTLMQTNDFTSRPDSINFVIPNTFISFWIIALIYREMVTYITF